MPSPVAVGLGLLAALAAAAALSTRGHADADPTPLVLLVAGVACALTAGVLLPRALLVPYGLAAAVGAGVLVLTAPDGLSGGALAGPLGYGNANGALCAQGSAAAMVPVHASSRRDVRVGSVVLGLVLVALAWQTASAAGLVAAAGAVATCVALRAVGPGHRARAARVVVTAVGAATAAVFAATWLLGATHGSQASYPSAQRLVEATLSERRVILWSEALDLLAAEPAHGVGAGRFAEVSPTARADADARWAHSGYLQIGAETGVPGLLAMLLVTAWVFASLYVVAGHDTLAAVGAAAAGALLAHASLDYVLHFPVVPLLAAGTVGVCLRPARPPSQTRQVPAEKTTVGLG